MPYRSLRRLVPPLSRRTVLAMTMLGVAVVAFVVRGHRVVRESGLDGLYFYDDGVYYAGAAALLHGRMPYADFTFLHPPGILLALLPFAGLGAATSDPVGLAAARIAFWVLGAVNAALVARVAAREGLGAAAVGGMAYALWHPAIYTEGTMLLQPLGNTALLGALLLLTPTEHAPSRRAEVLAGAVLGVSVCVKIWMVAPLAVVTAWRLVAGGWRSGVRVAVGSGVGAILLLLPFAGHPAALLRMVVLDQLGRPRYVSVADRVVSIFSVGPLATQASRLEAAMVLGAVGVVGLAAAVLAVTGNGRMRLYVALLGTMFAVLLEGPPFYHHYPSLLAVPWCLVLAAGVARVGVLARGRVAAEATEAPARAASRRWSAWLQPIVVAAACLGLIALYGTTLGPRYGRPFPARQFASAVADRSCVASDDPTVLAAMDVLTRDLRRGCPLVVDVFGLAMDRYSMRWSRGLPVPAADDLRWQRRMSGYLTSAEATVVVNPRFSGLGPATMARLRRLPVLAEGDGFQVRAGLGTPPTRLDTASRVAARGDG